jgi:transketolase
MNETKIVNTIRLLSVDMIEKANSGHPGMCLGCAPMIFILWCKIINFCPNKPLLIKRDRFILSNGHGCALLYSILYLLGYDYSIDDLKNFRQIFSKTPGHPEFNPKLGIEASTGPLGQGIANGVGMSIVSKKKGINNFIYVMCGDGCLMEGISYEAASLAGHLGLNNLILLYDDNGITIDGKTDITFSEDVRGRFKSLQWNVLDVENGDTDLEDIYSKLICAKESKDKPTIIFVKTTIGYGSFYSGKSSIHGTPLGTRDIKSLKELFGFDPEKSFFIDQDVKSYFLELKEKKEKYWIKSGFSLEEQDHPLFTSLLNTEIINCIRNIKNAEKNYSSRDSSSIVLKKISELLENILIGSADLAESNKTMVSTILSKNDFTGKYIHYGVREHSMCSIANGISAFGFLPVVSTFLVFITYCLAPIRMAALSKHKVIYVLTHDSVFLGEDGPTHQPIESLTILRSIPGLLTIRPCDSTEVSSAYQIALEFNGPSAIILSRQVLTNIDKSNIDEMKLGAYIIYENERKKDNEENMKLDWIMVATGSEVSLAIEVAKKYTEMFIRVVSMPCCELFDLQTKEYKNSILPKNIKKISLEAGSTLGWYKYVDYVYGIDTFGMSAKMNDIKDYYGFNVEKICSFLSIH